MDKRLIPMLALLYLLSFLDRKKPKKLSLQQSRSILTSVQVVTLVTPKSKASRMICTSRATSTIGA